MLCQFDGGTSTGERGGGILGSLNEAGGLGMMSTSTVKRDVSSGKLTEYGKQIIDPTKQTLWQRD